MFTKESSILSWYTESEWELLRKTNLDKGRAKQAKHEFPFKGRVICNFCKCKMQACAPRSKTGKMYLRYECRNKKCEGKIIRREMMNGMAELESSSMRAKTIIEAVRVKLEGGVGITKKELEEYLTIAQHNFENIQKERDEAIHSLRGRRSQIQSQKDNLIKDSFHAQASFDEDEKEVYQKEKLKFNQELNTIDEEIKKMQGFENEFLNDVEMFLNLVKSADLRWMRATAQQKDQFAEIMDLNFFCEGSKLVQISFGEPFATWMSRKFLYGGSGGS